MPAARGISLITLGVADVAASAAFYERLGFVRAQASQAEVVFFGLPGTALALFGAEALARDTGTTAETRPGFRGVTLARNLPSREAVDAEHAAWLEAGARNVVSPQAAFWGGYTSYVADPDGHVWELAHNPFFPLGEDGLLDLP